MKAHRSTNDRQKHTSLEQASSSASTVKPSTSRHGKKVKAPSSLIASQRTLHDDKHPIATNAAASTDTTPIKPDPIRKKKLIIPPSSSSSSSSSSSDDFESHDYGVKSKPATSLTSVCKPDDLDEDASDLPDKDYDGPGTSLSPSPSAHIKPRIDINRGTRSPSREAPRTASSPQPMSANIVTKQKRQAERRFQSVHSNVSSEGQATVEIERPAPPVSLRSAKRDAADYSNTEDVIQDKDATGRSSSKRQKTVTPEAKLADKEPALPSHVDLFEFIALAGHQSHAGLRQLGLEENDMDAFLRAVLERMEGMAAVERNNAETARSAVKECAKAITIEKVKALFRQ